MAKVQFIGVCIEEEAAECAGSLYDGDWRAGDKADLIAEYGITEELADEICKGLQAIEDDIKHEDRLNEAYKIDIVEVGGVTYELDYRERIVVTYPDGAVQIINGNDNIEDWAKIVLDGADPVADGWEDGAGHPIGEGTARMLADDDESEASRIVTIRADGKASYKITVTDLVRALNLDIGDQVKVTLRKI